MSLLIYIFLNLNKIYINKFRILKFEYDENYTL